ncbi:MAG: hypothetical protein ACRYG4_14630, partial [Janthinobacterium lividum]
MIVYGDRATTTDTADFLGRIAAGLRATATRPGGLDRHAGLVAALVATGELLQGVADADLAARGVDAPGAGQAACTALLMAVAEAVFGSWDRRFVAGPLPDAVVAAPLPRTIERRLAEGYAHYALYPEAYIAAARRLRLDNVRVIGI